MRTDTSFSGLTSVRAGREDRHFLHHSDTRLLSVPVGRTQRDTFCAAETDNGLSLSFPMKEQINDVFSLQIKKSGKLPSTLCSSAHLDSVPSPKTINCASAFEWKYLNMGRFRPAQARTPELNNSSGGSERRRDWVAALFHLQRRHHRVSY